MTLRPGVPLQTRAAGSGAQSLAGNALHRENKLKRYRDFFRRQFATCCRRSDGGDALPRLLGAVFGWQMPMHEGSHVLERFKAS